MGLNRIDDMEDSVVVMVDKLFFSVNEVLNSASWHAIRECISGRSPGFYEPDRYFKQLSDYVEAQATEYEPEA